MSLNNYDKIFIIDLKIRVRVMWEKTRRIINEMWTTVFCTFCKQWNEHLGRPYKRLLRKFTWEWTKVLAKVIAAGLKNKKAIMTEIAKLNEVCFNNEWNVLIHEQIGLKNYFKVFCWITWRNSIKAKINDINLEDLHCLD